MGFVAGEMSDPSRDLPRVIRTAMGIAVSAFVLMNVALFAVLPFDLMRERSAVAVVRFPFPPCSLDSRDFHAD